MESGGVATLTSASMTSCIFVEGQTLASTCFPDEGQVTGNCHGSGQGAFAGKRIGGGGETDIVGAVVAGLWCGAGGKRKKKAIIWCR